MKIIGYRLDSEYENGRAVSTKKFLTVVECCRLTVREYGDDSYGQKRHGENNYRVYISSHHPSASYFIISAKRGENSCYKWLTLKEAEDIIERAVAEETLDLRKIGDYNICSEGKIQSVIIMNDYDEFEDEPAPILVKAVK